MVSYKVIVSPKALAQLDDYVSYVHYTLLNPIAAKSMLNDAKDAFNSRGQSEALRPSKAP